jgi:thiol:disulfide interchange protein
MGRQSSSTYTTSLGLLVNRITPSHVIQSAQITLPASMAAYKTISGVEELDTLLSKNTFVLLDFWATW